MDNQLVEQLVNKIMQRLQKRTLLILTNASGYKNEIYDRLAECHFSAFSIYIADNALKIHEIDKWQQLGEIFDPQQQDLISLLSQYQNVLIPFMDFSTLGDLAQGIFNKNETQLIHYALMKNINTVALKYNCDPTSELNEILGLGENKKHNLLIKNNIEQLTDSGMQFCTIQQMESSLTQHQSQHNSEAVPEIDSIIIDRYITLNEVMKNPKKYYLTNNKLTDSAIDFLKKVKS
nr:hypothetical protein [uncultured Moellerella sp.]